MANAYSSAAEQLADCQSYKGCKEKNLRCSLDRGNLGQGLAFFLLIPLLGWAMLVFVVVLLLLSCSWTIFALMLHNVPKGQTSNWNCKVWIRSPFLMLVSCPCFVWPNPPTNLLEFCQCVMRSWLILVATATYMYITLIRPSCTLSY